MVDPLGRDVGRYGGDNSVWNVFFNPANATEGRETAVTDEIDRLYGETGEKGIFPSVAPYSVTYNGEKYEMTSQERTRYQRTAGQNTDQLLGAAITSPDYARLPDGDKAAVAQQINEYSLSLAKKELINGRGGEYEMPGWMEKLENMQESGGTLAHILR